MGLDIYLSQPGVEGEYYEAPDLDSAKYPEHICKKNYLRSSYNNSGFNSVVGALLEGRDLYWIFGPEITEEYDSNPTKEQLQAARERALQIVQDLQEAESLGVEFYSALPIRPDLSNPKSDEAALALYRRQKRENDERGGSPFGNNYSNAFGHFFFDDPLTVRSVIAGEGFMGAGSYLIFERDLTFYRQASEIVVEFIDYALAQEAPNLHWSS